MKYFLTALLLTGLSSAFGAPLHPAGPGISGGGQGVVCRDRDRKILSAEVLDLWEAREIYGLRAQAPRGSLREMVVAGLENLSHSFRADELVSYSEDGKIERGAPVVLGTLLNHAYPFFKKKDDPSNVQIRWLRNVNLTPTNDAYEYAQPADCAIEQIVSFGDSGMMSGKMLINQDLWDQLDETNQAALIIHEAYYKVLRHFSAERSSLRTRRVVGQLFSGHRFKTLSDADLPNEYYSCVRKATDTDRTLSERGVTEVFLLPIKNPNTGKFQVAMQASKLGNFYILGVPARASLGKREAKFEVERFDDLSGLVSRTMNYAIELGDSVQAEIDPSLKVDKAGPRGKLRVSVSVPPSVFLPEGLRRIPLSCQYVVRP